MPGKAHFYSDAVLNVLNGNDLSGVTPFVALFSAAPGDDGSAGTELTGNGYARQAITFGAPGGRLREPAQDREHRQHPVRPGGCGLAPGGRVRHLRRADERQSPVLEHARDFQDRAAG